MRGLDIRYFLRRIGMFFLVIFVAASFNFLIPRLAPGNPIGAITSRMANASAGRFRPRVTSSTHQAWIPAAVATARRFGVL